MLHPGLYEQIINKGLDQELSQIPLERQYVAPVDEAEAAHILSEYLSSVTQKAMEDILAQGGNLSDQVHLVNRIVDLIRDETKEPDYAKMDVAGDGRQLLALLGDKDPLLAAKKRAADYCRPETSVAQSSLFTGSVHEPALYSELKREIPSADRIDFLVSFIKWSGLRLILEELQQFTRDGGKLRIITTSYMGATDLKAVEELAKLPNTEIMISYDTKRTRLHAKTYVFYRESGFTTAYIGSSNLSNAAISSGLEWNVKVTRTDLPETMDKISATFESYWNSGEFVPYTPEDRERLASALKAERYKETDNAPVYTLFVHPYPYQQEILDRLEAERRLRGHWRNLVVAATGTGKTVISALDYRHFRKQNPSSPCRLLFVAHREELLKQSIDTFRSVLQDPNFGELYVGSYHPSDIRYLFISIQTFQSQDFSSLTAEDYYDYIVVDEFHHAAAPSYQKLLTYYTPHILLGLTATPERMDGKSVLSWFQYRIAAEIRLPEAIDRKLLCPFQYFGVTDTVNLNDLRWTRGGYDKRELSNVYVLSGVVAERRAQWVADSVIQYVTDPDAIKGLGFCVSVEHADFMADQFNRRGIPSLSLSANSPKEVRSEAKNRLVKGDLRFLFVVDLYNEGVDIPEVNTILFLRPTESLTIFLQQLGRGLRLSEGKECLTVLDFIGQANKRYRFEEKFEALLSGTSRSIEREIKNGFPSLPKGCYIHLEKEAQEYILNNIRAATFGVKGLLSRLHALVEDSGLEPTLENFLDFYRMGPRGMYRYSSFSRLLVQAEMRDDFCEPAEEVMKKAFPRFGAINSRRWISFLLEFLPQLQKLGGAAVSGLTCNEQRMLQMMYVTIWGRTAENFMSDDVQANLRALSESPVILGEFLELLRYQYDRIDFIDEAVDFGFECPLDLHCCYTRDQLFVALDYMTPSNLREGVKWLPEKKADVFLITLNKSDKDYSPTTMYNDYSINERLFHWQSQSTTSDMSATGQRYIHHGEQGSKVLLFVRERKSDPASGGAGVYTFLGTANYVSHEGSRPMNIIWRLDRPIPSWFQRTTNQLVVG